MTSYLKGYKYSILSKCKTILSISVNQPVLGVLSLLPHTFRKRSWDPFRGSISSVRAPDRCEIQCPRGMPAARTPHVPASRRLHHACPHQAPIRRHSSDVHLFYEDHGDTENLIKYAILRLLTCFELNLKNLLYGRWIQ